MREKGWFLAKASLLKLYYIPIIKIKHNNFSQVANEKPSELISAQASVIKGLEKQVADLQNKLFLSNSKVQEQERILDSKNQKILQNKRNILELNSLNSSLKQRIQSLGAKENSFNFENLKARILDMPYTVALKPLFEKLPELDLTISTKALEELNPPIYKHWKPRK